MNFSPCSWVLSGYSQALQIWSPNFTSQISVVFEIWRFKNLDFKNFQKVEDVNAVVGYCEGTLKGCESCLWLWLLKSSEFWRYDDFYDFLRNFQKTFMLKNSNFWTSQSFGKFKLQNTSLKWNSQSCSCVLSKIANIAIKKYFSNFDSFRDVNTFF